MAEHREERRDHSAETETQHEPHEGIPRQLRHTFEHTHEHHSEQARDHAVDHPHELARDDVPRIDELPRADAAARSRWRFSSAVDAARHLGNRP